MRETARAVGTTNNVEGSTAPFPEIRLRAPEFLAETQNLRVKGKQHKNAEL